MELGCQKWKQFNFFSNHNHALKYKIPEYELKIDFKFIFSYGKVLFKRVIANRMIKEIQFDYIKKLSLLKITQTILTQKMLLSRPKDKNKLVIIIIMLKGILGHF